MDRFFRPISPSALNDAAEAPRQNRPYSPLNLQINNQATRQAYNHGGTPSVRLTTASNAEQSRLQASERSDRPIQLGSRTSQLSSANGSSMDSLPQEMARNETKLSPSNREVSLQDNAAGINNSANCTSSSTSSRPIQSNLINAYAGYQIPLQYQYPHSAISSQYLQHPYQFATQHYQPFQHYTAACNISSYAATSYMQASQHTQYQQQDGNCTQVQNSTYPYHPYPVTRNTTQNCHQPQYHVAYQTNQQTTDPTENPLHGTQVDHTMSPHVPDSTSFVHNPVFANDTTTLHNPITAANTLPGYDQVAAPNAVTNTVSSTTSIPSSLAFADSTYQRQISHPIIPTSSYKDPQMSSIITLPPQDPTVLGRYTHPLAVYIDYSSEGNLSRCELLRRSGTVIYSREGVAIGVQINLNIIMGLPTMFLHGIRKKHNSVGGWRFKNKCDECDCRFHLRWHVINHKVLEHKKSKRDWRGTFFCFFCFGLFTKRQTLENHYEDFHDPTYHERHL